MTNPAVDYSGRGSKWWYKNGVRHKIDGPAIVWLNGSKEWWINGKRHREDGPAVERNNGYKQWWITGTQYTEAEFLSKTQPATELTIAEIEQQLGYKIKLVK